MLGFETSQNGLRAKVRESCLGHEFHGHGPALVSSLPSGVGGMIERGHQFFFLILLGAELAYLEPGGCQHKIVNEHVSCR